MAELRLIHEADLRGFPPRLPEQPIFYPVLRLGYAAQIVRDWNTKSRSFAGFVTRFEVEDDYVSRFDRRIVGGCEHEELWVPAEEIEEFNGRIVGRVGVGSAYFGPRFVGHVPEVGSFEGKGAVDQLVLLARLVQEDGVRYEEAVVGNDASTFPHRLFWGQDALRVEGITDGERGWIVAAVRRAWAEAYPGVPLTMKA